MALTKIGLFEIRVLRQVSAEIREIRKIRQPIREKFCFEQSKIF